MSRDRYRVLSEEEKIKKESILNIGNGVYLKNPTKKSKKI